jgi:preprotein translocase subunit YajC
MVTLIKAFDLAKGDEIDTVTGIAVVVSAVEETAADGSAYIAIRCQDNNGIRYIATKPDSDFVLCNA